MKAPEEWSSELRNAYSDEWKSGERNFSPNLGWKVLRSSRPVFGPLIPANLNTLSAMCGTGFVPDLNGAVLILEQGKLDLEREERLLYQLKLMGIFEKINGLLISKPETFDDAHAPFSLDELYLEILADYGFPIVSNFDCGHTHPSITIPVGVSCRLSTGLKEVELAILESAIDHFTSMDLR